MAGNWKKPATKRVQKPAQDPTFVELSSRLEFCIGAVQDLSTKYRNWAIADPNLSPGFTMPPMIMEHVVESLRGLDEALRLMEDGLRPHLMDLEKLLSDPRGLQKPMIEGRYYSTWHEGALNVVKDFHRDSCLTADPDAPSKIFKWAADGFTFDESVVAQNINAIVAWLANRPELNWEEICFGLRQERKAKQADGSFGAPLSTAPVRQRYGLFDLQQAARRLEKAIESIPSGAHQHRPLACPHYLHEIERLAIEFARRFRDDFAAAHGRWLTATSSEPSTALLTALSERTYHVHPNDMELTEKGKSTYWALVDNPAATLDRVAGLLRQAIESALAYAELPQKLDAERQAGRAGDIQDAGRGDTGNRAGVVREDARLKSHGGGQNTTVDVAVEHLAAATTTQELSADVNTKRQELPPTRRQRHLKWLATAMLLVRDHPDWSDAEIARQVNVDKSRLSRSPEYKAAAALARGSSADRHKGYVRTDPDSGLSDVEAVAPAADWCQDKTDRGQAVEGSKYFREYCAECGEAMKVTKDQVGKNPICKDCQP